jgi:hypothetical protein
MSGAASTTDASSEDVYQTPEAVRHLVIPRRGVVPGEPIVVDPEAAGHLAAWLADHSSTVSAIIEHEGSDPDLVAQYRFTPTDLATATPLVAAIAAAIAASPDTPVHDDPARIIDAWIATRGYEFATTAVLELCGVRASGRRSGREKFPPFLSTMSGEQVYEAYPLTYFDLFARLRWHLASASESDYAQAHEVLAGYRKSQVTPTSAGAAWAHVVTSFLMPENTAWVEDDFDLISKAYYSIPLALCSITTAHQAAAFPASRCTGWHAYQRPGVLETLLDNIGGGILPILATWLTRDPNDDNVQGLLPTVLSLPSDEALQFLIDNIDRKFFKAAVLSAAKNSPQRALTLLAEAALRETPRGLAAATVVRLYLLTEGDDIAAGLTTLTPAAREYLDKARVANVRLPDADANELPPLFVSPPWLTAVKPPKPVVITGLAAPTEVAIVWAGGERERWGSAQLITNPTWSLEACESIAESIRTDGTAHWYRDSHFAAEAPEELVRSVLPFWKPDSWQTETWIPTLAIRFGADALPPILSLARSNPTAGAGYLAPFAAPEAALLAADWLSRLKTARPFALAWLKRHPGVAARTLIPVALGKAGKARNAAELTIRTLAVLGFADEISEAAAAYGEAVAQAVAAIVADDGTLTLPKTMPTLPDWADPRSLPQVLLIGRQTALPEEAVKHLLLMLAVSKPGEPYAGLQKAKDSCDPESLAAFAWAVFENWRAAECPAKESWAFDALRWFGDDQAVRRLSPIIRQWPGENGHSRAVAGLDVLAEIGGDTALAHLYGISQKVKFKALKERATERVGDIADDLGLTAEQLGDRLVPDLGLEPAGTLTLDYGPRRFTVGFDEQLKPYVADQDGKRLKTLPKPGAKDDEELAPAAYQRFSALKKDVRAIAASQIARLELAMVTQRRWTAQEFGEYFAGHPVLRHLVQRLVWAAFTDDDNGRTAFRVAEDLSLTGVSDDEYTLADDAVVGIAHPLHLGEDLAAWSDLFADYEIVQPFEQLGRGVYALTDEELASNRITRFSGIDVPVGMVLGLERRGWRRGAPQDAGIQGWISRPLPGGGSVAVTLEPGITVGHIYEWSEVQDLTEVFLSRYDGGEGYWQAGNHATFAALDEITASEMLRDLTEITAG